MTDLIAGNLAGSGGGCFRAGTLVQQEHGKTTKIENLKVGDEVLSFDESGNIHVSKVKVVHFHESPEPLLRVKFWKGEVCITPNHWVLNQYGAFAEMGRLTSHDALVDGMGHLRPIIGAESIGSESVYNLTVEPNHTFIADGVRVHNGGHRERHPVVAGSGGGGGGKGGGRQAIEASDSLQSKARISILDLIGEGQIGGLVNGAKSIFLNNTPVQNADGTWNFTRQIPSINGSGVTTYAPVPFTYDFRDGTQNQTSIPGFPDVETARVVGVTVRHSTAPAIIAITNPNVDAVRLIVATSALSEQNTTTGDVSGSSVDYQFTISVNGGAYVALSPVLTMAGKTRSTYQRGYQYQLPKVSSGGQPATAWSIAMTRITPDSVSSAIQNEIRFDSLVEIVNTKLSYPNSAIVGLSVDSEVFSSVPARSYLVRGLYIKVPTNYDPVTRAYTGIWDGTFKMAVSDNPAWVMYDLLTEPRYGLGQFVAPSMVDRAKLYQIGRYCDALVPDGFGGMEPRFTCNTAIQNLGEAFKLISDLSSVFRGMTYWAGGMAGFTQDSPSTPTMMFTKANVIDGMFNYIGASRRDRHSVVLVTWNDPSQFYKQTIEYVEDAALIEKFGVRKMDVVAFGCTSRGQAHRVGKWILYTEEFESEFINFNVGLDATLCLPGEVVKIQDADRAGKRMGGRLIACTTTSATLDDAVVLAPMGAGVMPTISIRLADGAVIERTLIEQSVTTSVVTWATPLPSLPVANAVWVISEASLEPMLARIIGIAQSESKGEYMITALQHNPSKYAAIESNMALEIPALTIIDPSQVNVPLNLVIHESPYQVAPGTNGIMLALSWTGEAISYDMTWSRSGANQTNSVTTNTTTPTFDIQNALAGTYTFSITAINMFGRRSQPLVQTFTTGAVMPAPTALATFTATGGIMENALAWTFAKPTLSGDSIEILSSATNDILTATKIADLPPPIASYVDRGHDIGVTLYYWARLINASGSFSTWSTASATTIKDPSLLLAQLNGSITTSSLATALSTEIALISAPSSTAGSVAARLAAEVTARNSAIAAEASARTTAIAAEASARAAAITAEATARGTAITNEASVRQSGLDNLAQSISMVTAGVSGSFDPGAMWYFDTTSESWTATNGTIAHNLGWIEFTATGASPRLQSPTISVIGSQYTVIRARVKRLAGTGWHGSAHYSTVNHGNISTFKATAADPVLAIGEIGILEWDMTNLTAGGTDWVTSTITQIALDVGNTAADVFSFDWIAVGRNAPSASMSGLLMEQSARISADSANATSISALSAQVNNATSGLPAAHTAIVDEQTTRATADTALSTAITLLDAQVNSVTTGLPAAHSAITTEATARAAADTAISSTLTSLTSTVNAKATTFVQATAPTATATGDLWVDTANGNLLKRWSGSAWVDVRDTTIATAQTAANSAATLAGTKTVSFVQATAPTALAVGDLWIDTSLGNLLKRWSGTSWVAYQDTAIAAVSAALTTEQTTRAAADSAMAASITALTTTTNSNTAAITAEVTARTTADTALTTSVNSLSARLNTKPADFSMFFATGWNAADWTEYTGSGVELTVVAETTEKTAGGSVLQIGNNVGSDYAWIAHNGLIPFDSTRLYKMRVRLRHSAGAGAIYVGWIGVAADGVTMVNTGGLNSYSSQHYHCICDSAGTATFAEYVGYTLGHGATVGSSADGTLSSPATMHPNVRFLRPMILANYAAVAGIVSVDYLTVEDGSAAKVAADLVTEATARSAADTATASSITSLNSSMTTANSNITANANALTSLTTTVTGQGTTLSSHTTSISTLTTSVNNNATAITNEQTARSNADSALTTSISQLSARVAGSSTLSLTVSGGVTVAGQTATKSTGTAATWDGQAYSANSFKNGAFCSFRAGQVTGYTMAGLNSDPTTDASYASIDYCWYMAAGGSALVYESGTGYVYGTYTTETVFSIVYNGANVVYMKDGVVQRTVATTANRTMSFDSSFHTVGNSINSIVFEPTASSVAAAQADILTEATTRATADTANATAISTLSTTVSDHTTSISTQATSINGLSAQYTVKIDVNGYVSGYGLASAVVNGTPTSSFIVRADTFAVGRTGATTYPFVVGTVNGATTVGINGALVVDGSITTRHLAANSITAASGIIADAAIATAKIANAAITTAKIGAAQITTATIADAAIGTAQIANLAVTTANIGDLAVSTLKIAGNAVTTPVGAYTAAVAPYNPYGYVAQSAAITSSGNSIAITGALLAVSSNPEAFVIYLRRDGLIIYSATLQIGPGVDMYGNPFAGSIPFSTTMLDSPAAGAHTYDLYVVAGNISISNRALNLLETKR